MLLVQHASSTCLLVNPFHEHSASSTCLLVNHFHEHSASSTCLLVNHFHEHSASSTCLLVNPFHEHSASSTCLLVNHFHEHYTALCKAQCFYNSTVQHVSLEKMKMIHYSLSLIVVLIRFKAETTTL